ncbi:MAG: response regulator [Treponema sp.]
MKYVLIVDASPTFLEFLKDKLEEEQIEVTAVQGKRDALTKLISILPDLMILDINEEGDFIGLVEFLENVSKDPNARNVPIIAAGPIRSRDEITILAKYGIVKYFVKPIKFDIFFESVGHFLRTAFSMDVTPCVLDLHKNGNLIFIEIAQGLNREKIQLMKYKISEMIENDEAAPKIILMLSNLELTFIDGLNIEFLLDNVLANRKIQPKNIKILSLSTFVKELIAGHELYNGIEVVSDVSDILNSVVDSTKTSHVPDLISDNILVSAEDEAEEQSSIEMRFASDVCIINQKPKEERKEEQKPAVGLVDDDSVVTRLLTAAFETEGFDCRSYPSGTEFLAEYNKYKYDIIVLDIFMPGISGFDTLKRLKTLQDCPPVIVYSQAVDRDMITQILSLGAKQYIVKPQKPENIVQKALEILNAGQ